MSDLLVGMFARVMLEKILREVKQLKVELAVSELEKIIKQVDQLKLELTVGDQLSTNTGTTFWNHCEGSY